MSLLEIATCVEVERCPER